MTITIADGRGALWQWDTGRRVKITDGDGVKQVHYQNRCFGRSVDVDVGTDGTAIIPDELLQDWHPLTAYAYVTDDAGGYTKVQVDFAVHKRAKPAGYVYTPTDQMTMQTIQRQIGDLADLTTEAKDTLVAAINEAAQTGSGAGSMDLRVADGYVQYSRDGGMTWTNLIAMAELKGADGVTPHIGDNGNWYLDTTDTGKPSRGATGAPGEKGADGAPGIYYGTTQPTGDTHPVWINPDGDHDDGGLLPAVTAADNGKVLRVVSSAWSAEDMPTGGTDMGITGASVGQIAKITAVDASGTPTAWAPVDMPSGGGGGETWELVAEATTTDVVNSLRVTFDACSAVYVEFCWGGVENDLGDIAIYPNQGDTPYAGEKRAAAAYVKSSASRKRGMLCVRMDCRVGTYWTAVSNQKSRGDGAFGSINADNLLNMDIGVDPDVQYSVIASYYMTTTNDTPASGVKSITAYGAGMAIGTRIKVWGIKK